MAGENQKSWKYFDLKDGRKVQWSSATCEQGLQGKLCLVSLPLRSGSDRLTCQPLRHICQFAGVALIGEGASRLSCIWFCRNAGAAGIYKHGSPSLVGDIIQIVLSPGPRQEEPGSFLSCGRGLRSRLLLTRGAALYIPGRKQQPRLFREKPAPLPSLSFSPVLMLENPEHF